jgi:outer membrane protein assembly factor BamB
MRISPLLAVGSLTITLAVAFIAPPASGAVRGWTDWRGPLQTGVSLEKGLPSAWALNGTNDLWSYDISGGGTPIIANGKLYAFSYEGQGPDLQEVLLCVDAETGKKLWEKRFNDFLSDIVYDRYAIGSPAVDPETGNVYVMTSAGLFSCLTGDGKPVWQRSLMEEIGRLTFTNGRTGSPLVVDDLVIIRGITSNWGAEGAASDRLYAYDKKSGNLVWSSTPAGAPKDNSFARPWVGMRNGKQVLYTGSGDGSVVCVNARTGEPIWRYPISAGGLNSSVIGYKNMVVAIHADENLDSSDAGRMVAIKTDVEPKPAPTAPPGGPALPATPIFDKSAEAWRNELGVISSSPVLVGNRIYQVNKIGQLCCVDADTGNILWRHKLAPDQLHASPLYADGKLYIPFQNGMFYIIKPSDTSAEELSKVQLEGRCIGAPSAWNGKVYVHTTERLYCFGKKGNNPGMPPDVGNQAKAAPGKTVALQILPSEVLLRPGEKATFTIRGIDANGFVTETFDSNKAKWAKYIPPTARVRAEMNGDFNEKGELVAAVSTKPSAGAFEATIGDYKGYVRGRVISALPFTQDFESFEPSESLPADPSAKFAYPPLPWIGARFKFDIRDVGGNKVLAKTLDNVFFQRAMVFFGHPDDKNYTFEADVMSDGNRRTMSSVGVINQHYMVVLNGNAQELEVSSNHERIKQAVPFKWVAKEWYHLKTRVDVAPDGSGVVRAKAWKKSEAEPAAWTIEVPHKNAHAQGSPGLFGFAPQSQFKVYVDNISITPNK